MKHPPHRKIRDANDVFGGGSLLRKRSFALALGEEIDIGAFITDEARPLLGFFSSLGCVVESYIFKKKVKTI
tara:strand:- start:203 stop:418 length:216 start_codon:yes stop_codon:yes gene_type:complete